MDIKYEIKSGMKLASDAASDAVQALVEKSRLKANANRIRMVIKSDTGLRNQAYIELGRYVYENMRDQLDEDNESLCVIVDKTSKRIDKATQKYVEYLNRISETKLCSENSEKLKKAVYEKAADISEKTKLKAQDIKQAAKETVADISYKAKDKVEDIKAFVISDEEIEDLVFEQEQEVAEFSKEENKADKAQAQQQANVTADVDDEESPEEFEF